MKLFLFISLIFLSSIAHSQNLQLGITGNIGFSKMYSKTLQHEYVQHDSHYIFSWNAGIVCEKEISKISSIGLELLWVQIEGDEEIVNEHYLIYGTEFYGYTSNTKTHASYIGVPVYYSYTFKKFAIKGGLQGLIFLSASREYTNIGNFFGEEFFEEGEVEELDFDGFEIGPKIGLEYQLGKGFAIRSDFFIGLNEVKHLNKGSQQLTMGLNYFFLNK